MDQEDLDWEDGQGQDHFQDMRDQLSFPYVLWKNHYCIDDIGFLGNNLRACPKLIIKSHNNLK